MQKINEATIEFLKQLTINNNKEWFGLHRQEYLSAKNNFENFVQEIIDEIIDFDPIMKGLEAKSCIFRINRDVRFSNDKSPYKTNMGAFLVKGGKKNGDKFAGYYFHIAPGKSMLAGGSYMPDKHWLASIRENIDSKPEKLTSLIKNPGFRRYFGQLDGDKLKKAPKGYQPDHAFIELLKHKSFLAVHEVADNHVLDDNYFKHSISVFRAMKPLNDFLNEY